MLRKLIHIVVLISLLSSTMGITISKHYCNNKLVSKVINSETKKCCGKSCNSCHTEKVSLKINDDYQDTNHDFQFQELAVIVKFTYLLFDSKEIEDETQDYNTIELPPPLKIQRTLSKLQTYIC